MVINRSEAQDKAYTSSKPRLRYLYRSSCAAVLAVLAALGFLFVWVLFVHANNHTGYLLGYGNLSLAAFLYILLFCIIGRFLNAFKIGVERKTKQIASVILTICITDLIEVMVSITILNDFRYFENLVWRYAILALIQSIVLSLTTMVMVEIYRKIVRPLPVVLIRGKLEDEVEEKLRHIPQKYLVEKSYYYDDPDLDYEKVVDECVSVLIDEVPANVESTIIKLCFEKDKRIYVVPKLSDIILKASDSINVMDTPLYLSRNLGLGLGQRILKRVMDLFFCGLGVIVLSPLFLIVSLAIKLEDGGPVFFRQERVTKDGKHFMILKFRSMIVDAEKDGRPHPAEEKDDRITKVGRLIRACRIDELPQLFNILSGDMSIVGPRPERYEHVEKYNREIPEFKYREKVKGGLTGYSQVYGKYNTSPLDKLKLDLMYITNYSLLLDIQIVFETVKILFQKESTEGFSEMKVKEMHEYDAQTLNNVNIQDNYQEKEVEKQ